MSAQGHVEKTCSDCKRRDCSPITRMAERLDAWKSAQALLAGLKYDDDIKGPSPIEVGSLAAWLYEGSDSD